MDLLVRKPSDLEWRLREGESFHTEIVGRGIVLYEKGHAVRKPVVDIANDDSDLRQRAGGIERKNRSGEEQGGNHRENRAADPEPFKKHGLTVWRRERWVNDRRRREARASWGHWGQT